MVFHNMKYAPETKQEEPSLTQYNTIPPKSPESPDLSEPNGENQEAIVIFSKGVAKQRKLSRNKQTSSGTAVGQEGEVEELITNHESLENDS